MKKRARKTKADNDQDDGGEANGTPTKKPRTPKSKNSAAVVDDDAADGEETIKQEGAEEETGAG